MTPLPSYPRAEANQTPLDFTFTKKPTMCSCVYKETSMSGPTRNAAPWVQEISLMYLQCVPSLNIFYVST
jgi:hypothetical protein